MNPQQLARSEVNENKQIMQKRLAPSRSIVSDHLKCEPKLTHTDGTFVVRARIQGAATRETNINPVVRCEGSTTFGELALKPSKRAGFEYEASFPANLVGVDYHGARLVLYP